MPCESSSLHAPLHLKSSLYGVQVGHCIIIKYICCKLVVYEICYSACTVVHSFSGSGAGVREITGDYRNTYTRRPSVMQKVSRAVVYAGQQPVRPRQLVPPAQNIEPCYQALSCSLVASLGAL